LVRKEPAIRRARLCIEQLLVEHEGRDDLHRLGSRGAVSAGWSDTRRSLVKSTIRVRTGPK
jgi:hypothetical protein